MARKSVCFAAVSVLGLMVMAPAAQAQRVDFERGDSLPLLHRERADAVSGAHGDPRRPVHCGGDAERR